MTPLRQYVVTHRETGQVTFVIGRYGHDYRQTALRAGLRYPVDCDVNLVPEREERPLPFDTLPLVLCPCGGGHRR